MRLLYIYGTSRFRRMYLHDPGLTQFKDWDVTCVNGMMRPQKLIKMNSREWRGYNVTVLHGYQCFRHVKAVDRRKLGLLIFVPSNDLPWWNGRNSQAVEALKPEIILPEQRIKLKWYKSKAKKYCEWFPPACAIDVFKPDGKPVTHDIAFAGTMARKTKYGKRNKWVRGLGAEGFKVLARSGVTQQDFNETYNRGFLAFHMSQFLSEGKASQGIAYRVFEVGGIGRPLLLDASPEINALFEDGVHFIGYSSWKDCLEKVEHYVKEDRAEAERIGQAMRDEILAKHTYQHRGKRLRRIIAKYG